MIIRRFRPEDAAQLGQVFYRSVHVIGGGHYSQAQVNAWAPSAPSEELYIARANDERVVLVAVADDGALLAYGDLQLDGQIDHLYRAPEAARMGVAASLYEHLEQIACGLGLAYLHVEASEPARRFFSRRGFATVKRQDFVLRGVPIHNYSMEKRLAREAV